MRLERAGAAVIVAPSGELRGRSVERLREIIRSREPGLELLVLDLRDVVDFGEDGVAFLVEECARGDDLPHAVAVIVGPYARRRLETDPRSSELELHDDADAVLAPHRRAVRARRSAAR